MNTFGGIGGIRDILEKKWEREQIEIGVDNLVCIGECLSAIKDLQIAIAKENANAMEKDRCVRKWQFLAIFSVSVLSLIVAIIAVI